VNIHIVINVYYHSQNFNKLEGKLLLQFIDDQRISKKQIAEDLGMSRRNLYQLFESKTLEPETKKKFEDYFKKEIFKEQNQAGDIQESYLAKRRHIKNASKEVYFPVYNGNARLREDDRLVVYNDDPEEQIPVGFLPQHLFPGCDHAEKAFGNSMYPRVVNQGVVAGKVIDKNHIVFGEMYGIHLVGGSPPVIKFVQQCDEPDCILLVSENKSIKDQVIHVDKIRFMYRVIYIINPA
jgi:AraC-like DNA-binding protein